MAVSRGFLLLGFPVLLVILFLSQWDKLQEKTERINPTQEQRKQTLRESCKGFTGGKSSIKTLTNGDLKQFIVDDTHGIIYCYIPKVACTNWKRVMFALTQSEPYPDPMSISGDLVHIPDKFRQLNHFSRPQMRARLRHYTKFLFVRDPFVRLISAYRDKFQPRNEYYYQNFGREILRLYGNQPHPPLTVDEAFASGVHVSFYNFIQYILDPRTEAYVSFEPHWKQMHRLCHPCLIDYDFVGHQETLQDDAKELLKTLKLEHDINFPPSYENMTSPKSVTDWFRTVPLEDRRKLYKLYEGDFKLLGYRKPSELLDG
ncbi:carbohydrate sulfotransferase 12-like [Mugil cephalus]|uniref:carbohydrate sulfotransferase 12-like n=1 Tax=Mugil cephalus TaxID=48193 RepID=UPI001FB749E0|nr:carbohydrate sulfotransferase 12-like [Mugil cephalus]